MGVITLSWLPDGEALCRLFCMIRFSMANMDFRLGILHHLYAIDTVPVEEL